jgi:signal transduction histidine kinase
MLAATAVLIAVGLLVIGDQWKFTLAHLLASAVIVLPRRWAVVGGCLILAAVVPIDLWVNPLPNPLWTMLVIVQRAGAVLVPTWFAGVLRELRATREMLAEQAVLRERIRIDGELTRTVGDSLRAIAGRGAAAAALTDADPDRARSELWALVDNSRRALAQARRLIRAYRPLPLRAELDTAMTLLSAAGISARLALPDRDLPRYADPELREALHAAVDRLLREQPARTQVITLDASAGYPRLTVAADGAAR